MAVANIASITLSSINPPNFMLRDPPTPGEIAELADSIQAHGLIEPLVVRPQAGKFEIVAGYRRYLACRKLRMQNIPCVVNEVDNATALILGLSENLDRRDASPIRTANAIYILQDKEHMTTPTIGKRLGKTAEWVSRMIRLSKNAKLFSEAFNSQYFTLSHFFEVIVLKDEKKITEAVDTIIEKRLSFRETRKLVQQLLYPQSIHRKSTESEEHGAEGAQGIPMTCVIDGKQHPPGQMHKVIVCEQCFIDKLAPLIPKKEPKTAKDLTN